MNNETVTIPAEVWKQTLIKVDLIKAEFERLKDEIIAHRNSKEKIESLIKAGNALALLQSPQNYSPEQVKRQCVLDWVNAMTEMDAK
jgi:hypothetical protein